MGWSEMCAYHLNCVRAEKWFLHNWGFLHIPPKRVHRFGGICKNPQYNNQLTVTPKPVHKFL
ncbi:hypothetical protein Krac_6162 [Ktedonobacter racemifer DSM 44963]|uniref:Uncharacterized protein n=1 Tax=Ktedonobacter racemifer DSM 44963 TaxID=485913 RepID=D6TY31_KTERA|nr:hypothetical protein Krac_6162 [Ktedonobacter racemifer DSM 44963]